MPGKGAFPVLPSPPRAYDPANEAAFRRSVEQYLQTVMDFVDVTVAEGGGGWTTLTDYYLPRYDAGGDELVDSWVRQDVEVEWAGAYSLLIDHSVGNKWFGLTVRHLNDTGGSWVGIETYDYGSGVAYFSANRVRGSYGSEAAVQANDTLGIYYMTGFDGTDAGGYTSIQARAMQNFTGSAQGTDLRVITTKYGTTTEVTNAIFNTDTVDGHRVTAVYDELSVQGANAIFEIYDDDYYDTDTRRWQWRPLSNVLYFRGYNWAESSFSNILKIQRDATTKYRPSQFHIFPDWQSATDQVVMIGSVNTGVPGLLLVGNMGSTPRAGIGIYNGGHLNFENSGGITPASELRWTAGGTTYGTIWLDPDDLILRFINRSHQQHVLDFANLSTTSYWQIKLHTTSGPTVLQWVEGSGLGWTESTGGITKYIQDSADVLALPLANAAWLTWRNVGDTANINVLRVDANDDTILAADTSDQILFYIGATLAGTFVATGGLTLEYTLTMNTADIYLSTGYAVRAGDDLDHAYLPKPAADQSVLRSGGNITVQVDSDNTGSANYFEVRHDSTSYSGGTRLFAVNEGLWLEFPTNNDAGRPAAGTAGRVFFNTDDGNLNIDTGAAWILPDGTTT